MTNKLSTSYLEVAKELRITAASNIAAAEFLERLAQAMMSKEKSQLTKVPTPENQTTVATGTPQLADVSASENKINVETEKRD